MSPASKAELSLCLQRTKNWTCKTATTRHHIFKLFLIINYNVVDNDSNAVNAKFPFARANQAEIKLLLDIHPNIVTI